MVARCGERGSDVSKPEVCPTCGRPVLLGEAPPRPSEETLSERDQTSSDRDQTLADQDQTASDRDSGSSTEDQLASDQDFAAGGDAVVHERTRLARAQSATARDEASGLRDESASARLDTAGVRDRAAEARDREAAERDALAALDAQHPYTSLAEVRLQAERNRAHAAADRARAAADREAAARDREEARRLQARAEQEIRAVATDELTGAFTRRFGRAQIGREIERARRTGGTLTLSFVDVDDLKEVNDTLGHAGGDRLLRLVAETIRANLRSYDVVVRYGGDEFLCAMPNVDTAAARERMTAIASSLSAEETGHSISFGLAEHRSDEEIDGLIERADSDLLRGRDRRQQDA